MPVMSVIILSYTVHMQHTQTHIYTNGICKIEWKKQLLFLFKSNTNTNIYRTNKCFTMYTNELVELKLNNFQQTHIQLLLLICIVCNRFMVILI